MERLDKILASQGTLSRRDVKEIVKKGRVSINGIVAKKSDIKIDIDNCNVLLNLSDINGINQVLDDISIDSLKFDGEAVKISACLR